MSLSFPLSLPLPLFLLFFLEVGNLAQLANTSIVVLAIALYPLSPLSTYTLAIIR